MQEDPFLHSCDSMHVKSSIKKVNKHSTKDE